MQHKGKKTTEKRAVGCRGTATEVLPGVMEKLMQIIQQVSYGEIVITIHDSKIVQVEKREKTRFRD